MQEVNFLQDLHTKTKRDYLARMNHDKPMIMRVAKLYGFDYWDGDRRYGYGGMVYDGRYRHVAEAMAKHYGLNKDNHILDIGCGKGFLAYDLHTKTKAAAIGIDISEYAIKNGIGVIKVMPCTKIEFPDHHFDFTYSINVFHNLCYSDLKAAIKEMCRVSKDKKYICVESYRNEEELCALQCWALTCASFYTPDDWKNILSDNGYDGDVEFIYFT